MDQQFYDQLAAAIDAEHPAEPAKRGAKATEAPTGRRRGFLVTLVIRLLVAAGVPGAVVLDKLLPVIEELLASGMNFREVFRAILARFRGGEFNDPAPAPPPQ